jgi:hypothetical protein
MILLLIFNSSLDWVWSYIHSWKSYSYGHINETPLPGFNLGFLHDFMLSYFSNTYLE